jgi:hypothetical protein
MDRFHNFKHHYLGVSALRVLGSMNKAIQKEARATFWSLAKFDLHPQGRTHNKAEYIHCKYDYYSIIERFLYLVAGGGFSLLHSSGRYRSPALISADPELIDPIVNNHKQICRVD